MDILVLIRENRVLILLDTSGDPLHKRGWRLDSLEAPLKESLASGLVSLSNWRWGETLYDPFCGSGTIAIEAALMARNIAPGMNRNFAFERFGWYNSDLKEAALTEANEKIIRDKTYRIVASDIDESAIKVSRRNAQRAGVDSDIVFEKKDISEYISTPLEGTLVSNPPY